MGFLIVPREEGMNFETDSLRTVLMHIDGTTNIHDVDRQMVELEWSFETGGEAIQAELQRGGAAINIEPENAAAATFATLVARHLAFDTDLIDDQYSFHLQLDRDSYAADLLDAIASARSQPTD